MGERGERWEWMPVVINAAMAAGSAISGHWWLAAFLAAVSVAIFMEKAWWSMARAARRERDGEEEFHDFR